MACVKKTVAVAALSLGLGACTGPWNDPYPASDRGKNILYSSFAERPKHLDPAQSYFENEFVFTGQIYMPPLQYHYLKRPYELVPFAAAQMPEARYFDSNGRRLPDTAPAQRVDFTVYEIRIRSGILYQPHPAFAMGEDSRPLYIGLGQRELRRYRNLPDFRETGTRELVAEDFVYQIKRLAHPKLHSPIVGLMSEYIVGLRDYAHRLEDAARNLPNDVYLDLDQFNISGVRSVDRYTYQVRINGKYPQFLYWLAMPFFSPVPHEAERFYRQPGMPANLSLDWYPVGTGPYMLTLNNPNRTMRLERNPNFAGEPYPSEGEDGDAEAGLLDDAGSTMPFIDKAVFSLEKESIPYWNKFLQGYYDASGITPEGFDQTVLLTPTGEARLTEEMRERGINLQTSVSTSTIYLGFNMLDPLVGGRTEQARKLRQAISIAVDMEELISIFRNGRGVLAHSPLPPGIFGHREGEEGINSHVYDWVDGTVQRKPVEEAKALLAEAGYPNGFDAETGRPLIVYLDTTLVGPEGKSRADWFAKQFQKIDLQLVIRISDLNRLQEKLRNGTAQIYLLGWNADYPDPENFMTLLYGPRSRAKVGGDNASNYANPEFDTLFERMRNMENTPEREQIIRRMTGIVQRDAPWAFAFHPTDYTLHHAWVYNRKPNKMAINGLKYQRIDPDIREQMRREWNRPVVAPLLATIAVLIAILVPGIRAWRRREGAAAVAPLN
ncbi:MAG TPA: ABC transporter substrate-binding protein [Burkholderiales bacterium]|nr:ABC transporter substrate-binding protein [Burkholderiales bacterium]